MSRAFVICSVWSMWAWAMPAHAYEDQASIDAELAYAHAVSDSTPAHGGSLGLGASYGLDNAFTVRGQFAWSFHPGERSDRSIALLSVELLYVLDVLEFVPYFGLGVDGVGTLADSFEADLGVHPVLGVDWLLAREWALGLQARSIVRLTSLDTDPVYLKVGVSASYLIDLF